MEVASGAANANDFTDVRNIGRFKIRSRTPAAGSGGETQLAYEGKEAGIAFLWRTMSENVGEQGSEESNDAYVSKAMNSIQPLVDSIVRWKSAAGRRMAGIAPAPAGMTAAKHFATAGLRKRVCEAAPEPQGAPRSPSG